MPRTKLTQKIINQLDVPVTGNLIYYWDEALSSFGVRVYISGKRSYVVRYVYKSKERFQTLGSCQVLKLEDAREMARRTLANVTMGVDPEPKQEARALTLAELHVLYMERHAKVHKRSWDQDERRYRLYLEPAFGCTPINEITRQSVIDLHHEIGSKTEEGHKPKPVQANRVKEQLSKMFNLAVLWGKLPENHSNPTTKVIDFPEVPREKWMSAAEIRRLAQSLSKEPNQFIVGAVWIALLTGLRKREILDLRWDQIDLHQCYLRIPGAQTKSGNPVYQPLSPLACRVFADLPRQGDNDYVFCGGVPGKPIFQIQKGWNRIRKQAGLLSYHFHDLRHTSASIMVQAGVPLQVAGRVLNHETLESTQKYAHLDDRQSRNAVNILAEQVSKFIE